MAEVKVFRGANRQTEIDRAKIIYLQSVNTEALKEGRKRQKWRKCWLQAFFPFISNFTKQQNFRLVQIQSICRRQNKSDSKIEICVGKSRKHCGKRRKCWLPAFSPFPIMLSKAFFSRGVKSADCVVKG